MSIEERPEPEHVFDQTNGLLEQDDETDPPAESSERERRRQVSMAQGFGYISTGHN